jgi:hypothetical protein
MWIFNQFKLFSHCIISSWLIWAPPVMFFIMQKLTVIVLRLQRSVSNTMADILVNVAVTLTKQVVTFAVVSNSTT